MEKFLLHHKTIELYFYIFCYIIFILHQFSKKNFLTTNEKQVYFIIYLFIFNNFLIHNLPIWGILQFLPIKKI
jgi:hypothetical protein